MNMAAVEPASRLATNAWFVDGTGGGKQVDVRDSGAVHQRRSIISGKVYRVDRRLCR